MAIADLMDRISGRTAGETAEDDVDLEVPDDLSGLEDFETPDDDLLKPDPKPVRKKAVRVRSVPSKTTAAQKRQIKDNLIMILAPTTGLAAMKDPHCGAMAFKQHEAIADAMVPIICRNPAMLRWFTGNNSALLDYLALASALWPVASTVYQHHIKKSVGEHDGGGGIDLSAYSA